MVSVHGQVGGGCGECDPELHGGFGEVVCHIHWGMRVVRLYKSVERVEGSRSTSTLVPFILPALLTFHTRHS